MNLKGRYLLNGQRIGIYDEPQGKIPAKKPKKTYLRKTRIKPIFVGDGAVARAKSMLQQQGLIKNASKTQRKNPYPPFGMKSEIIIIR